MASDNKVSSFFLLILIGLAIYYLLNLEGFNPLSNITNKLQESFVNDETPELLDETDEVVDETDETDETYETDEQDQPEETVDETGYDEGVSNNSMELSTPEIQYEEPIVPQSVINDIATNQVAVTQQVPSVSVVQPQMNAGVYTFQPNDESELSINGSNLNDAFALPIPNGTQTDTVDFKKQNVDNYNARDFLPREVNDEWFETDFSLAKYQLNDDKLINTERYIIGINTVGQSLKNASWDIRGTIPNPKVIVSPWGNSTYEPDFNLKPLC